MHNSPISSLSQELLDEIIDAVASQNSFYRANLSSCSLIGNKFRSRSQMHLFNTIGFGSSSSNTRIRRTSRLLNVLVINPQLASHVKEIRLYVPPTDSLWIWEDAKFTRIVNIIYAESLVTTLKIHGASNTYEHSEDFMHYRSNFFTMINHSLKYLSLKDFQVFPLPAIDLHRFCVPPDKNLLLTGKLMGPQKLTRLDLSELPNSVKMITYGIDFSYIQKLRLRLQDIDDVGHVQTLLEIVHASLECLDLWLCLLNPQPYGTPTMHYLPCFRKLRSLQMRAVLGQVTLDSTHVTVCT